MLTKKSNQTTHGTTNLLRLVCVLALCGSSLGCSSLLGRSRGPLSNLDPDSLRVTGLANQPGGPSSVLTENGEPCVLLEVRNGKKHVEKIPLRPGEPMFVGQMFQDAQLYKRLGKVKLTIMRPNGPERPPVRLDVDFDSTGQKVMEAQNYSLRAGDRIIVTPDDSSVFTDMMRSLGRG